MRKSLSSGHITNRNQFRLVMWLVFCFIFSACQPNLTAQPGAQASGGAPSIQTNTPDRARTIQTTLTATPNSTPTPESSITPTATETFTATPEPPGVVLAAGDISECGEQSDDQTAALILQVIRDFPQAQVITAGDNAYEKGTPLEFEKCFQPSWGQFKDRIHPSPGNHEYQSEGAAGYFGYFGDAAGDPRQGYYSFNLGEWHLISLNSNCGFVGGCGPSSPQVKWLQEDLAANPSQCTLAYWHHPRWSSGLAGSNPGMDTFWRTLADHGVDVVVAGHDHDYERFTPMNGAGEPDSVSGMREFVVGTGGGYQREFDTILPVSEAHATEVFGVLGLKLHPGGYEWEFLGANGAAFTDTGSGRCH